MKKFLTVDYSNVFWRSSFAHNSLSFKGKSTGATFGFLEDVIDKIDKLQAAHVLVCRDTGPYFRKKDCVEYKADRPEPEPEMQAISDFNMPHINNMLDLAGIPAWSIKGMEADDLMYVYAREMKKQGKVYLLSNDTDMYPAFKGTKKVFLLKKGKSYGLEDFRKEFPNLNIKDWYKYTALVGTHNGLKGIHGVGPVKATIALNEPAIYDKLYAEHKKIIKRNMKMIPMPYVGKRDIDLTIPTAIPELRVDELHDYLWDELRIRLTNYHISVLKGLKGRTHG